MNNYDINNLSVRIFHVLIAFFTILLVEIYLEGYLVQKYNILNVNFFAWLLWLIHHADIRNLFPRLVEEFSIMIAAFYKLNSLDQAAFALMIIVALILAHLVDRILLALKRGRLS